MSNPHPPPITLSPTKKTKRDKKSVGCHFFTAHLLLIDWPICSGYTVRHYDGTPDSSLEEIDYYRYSTFYRSPKSDCLVFLLKQTFNEQFTVC